MDVQAPCYWIGPLFPKEGQGYLGHCLVSYEALLAHRKLTYFFTGSAPELIGAVDALGCAHDTSIPGDSKNNSLIERT